MKLSIFIKNAESVLRSAWINTIFYQIYVTIFSNQILVFNFSNFIHVTVEKFIFPNKTTPYLKKKHLCKHKNLIIMTASHNYHFCVLYCKQDNYGDGGVGRGLRKANRIFDGSVEWSFKSKLTDSYSVIKL